MIAQIDHAGDVIRRMRDFMRRGRPHISTVAVRELLEDALILVKDAARTRGVRIELDLPERLPNIHCDAVQLQQVVVNLVQNAIDSISAANQREGRIHIIVVSAEAPPRLEFRIQDNGTGLDDEAARHVFEPLTTSKSEGLGLGLAICASIVQSHGGRIWLESGARGATEFRFWIPVDAPEAPR
jgi:two-component system, LuxR family, sensor kinase FixL